MYSSQFDWDRYYGTLVANMNFQLDKDYEQFWHALKTSDCSETFLKHTMFQTNVGSSQLQNDLVRLLDIIIPSQNISLTDVLGLLGYSNSFEVNEIELKTDVSNVNGIDCSTFDASFQSTCRNIESMNVLHPLHGLDPMHLKRTACNLGLYFERWNEYLLNLGNITNLG